MKLLFLGSLWDGSTSMQRLNAFKQLSELEVVAIDSGERPRPASLLERIRYKLRWPSDDFNLKEKLLEEVNKCRPAIVFIDSTRVFWRRTIQLIRVQYGALAVFYSPDDVNQPHNSSRQLESCDAEWDIFFTTKTFNVPELRKRGVRQPVLIGKSFDPAIHRPMIAEEVGPEYERFDVVFAGTYESFRMRSLNYLAEAGVNLVVYGNNFPTRKVHPAIALRAPLYGLRYTAALHTGKLALCFLRKLNRDRVTQRSVEIPGAGRPMLAERTEEHDRMFLDGVEYVAFESDEELLTEVNGLLRDPERRRLIANKGRERAVNSGFNSVSRAREMLGTMAQVRPE